MSTSILTKESSRFLEACGYTRFVLEIDVCGTSQRGSDDDFGSRGGLRFASKRLGRPGKQLSYVHASDVRFTNTMSGRALLGSCLCNGTRVAYVYCCVVLADVQTAWSSHLVVCMFFAVFHT